MTARPGGGVRRRSLLAGLPAGLLALAAAATGLRAAGLTGAGPAAAAPSGAVTVFAAASLKTALDGIAAAWHAESGGPLTISYAASSALAKQIENGAPADLFISADPDWMDYLQERALIAPRSRVSLLGNALVLIAPKDSNVRLAAIPGMKLAQALGDGRLAMADPRAVPAGKYGKAALQSLGVWAEVAGHLAAAENVRAAMLLVAHGEAPLGIVYRTDAAAEPAVRIVAEFPAGTHPPIIYPMALTATAAPAAARFEGYLRGPAAARLFEAQGFTVLDRAR